LYCVTHGPSGLSNLPNVDHVHRVKSQLVV
jgi:hypothetical protein